jgi:hypothetical protein
MTESDQMTPWTQAQAQTFMTISGVAWSSPCEHPRATWWVNNAGVAKCGICAAVWDPTVEAAQNIYISPQVITPQRPAAASPVPPAPVTGTMNINVPKPSLHAE